MSGAALQAWLRSEAERAARVFVLDEELAIRHGLAWTDFVLLHAVGLDHGGGVPEPELASQLGLRRSKLLMGLRPLEKLGLLARRADARGPVVALRPAGMRVLHEASETAAMICGELAPAPGACG